MNKLKYIVAICAFFVIGCGKVSYKNIGDIKVSERQNLCINDSTTNWLLDIEATLENDSIYLNTNGLPNKLEIKSLDLLKPSTLLSELSKTCVGDSVLFIMPADSFYLALGGSCPTFLKGKDIIKLKIWMRDKLKPMQYAAHKQAFENELVAEYIRNSKWNGTLDSVTQIYYEYLKSNDDAIRPFKQARFKYVIKTLSDKVIAYSKEEDPLLMDASDKSILLGIQFLSKKLAVGESIRAVLPSAQAFGPYGNSRVDGYAPIVVEIELLSVVK